jgi:hypothetical protein
MKILNKISVIGVLLSALFYIGACGSSSSSGTSTINPSGSGSVTLDPVTKVLTGSFNISNVVNANNAHIHDGNVGVAGPVVVPLVQSVPGTWSVPATAAPLTDPQIARLRAGGYYVNIHTVLNPAGEIRGQLGPASATGTVFTAILTLAAEVPTPILPVGAAY